MGLVAIKTTAENKTAIVVKSTTNISAPMHYVKYRHIYHSLIALDNTLNDFSLNIGEDVHIQVM